MTGWLLNLIPWWVWAIVAAALLLIVRGYLGSWRNVVAAAGLVGGAILALAGFQRGWKASQRASESRQQAKERQDVQTVQKHKTDAQGLPDEKLDKEVKKWTRG